MQTLDRAKVSVYQQAHSYEHKDSSERPKRHEVIGEVVKARLLLQRREVRPLKQQIVSVDLAKDKTGHTNRDRKVEDVAPSSFYVSYVCPSLDFNDFLRFLRNQVTVSSQVA